MPTTHPISAHREVLLAHGSVVLEGHRGSEPVDEESPSGLVVALGGRLREPG